MDVSKMFKMMYKLPRSGIYCLFHEKNKRIYIFDSRNIVVSLSRNIQNIQDKVHVYKHIHKDYKKLELRILDEIYYEDSKMEIDGKLHYWINIYKQLGYECYNRNISVWRVKIVVDRNMTVYVKLISRRYNEIVVGVFDNIDEAKEYTKVYENMDYIRPVYATNTLTKEYVKDCCG